MFDQSYGEHNNWIFIQMALFGQFEPLSRILRLGPTSLMTLVKLLHNYTILPDMILVYLKEVAWVHTISQYVT